MSLTKDGFQILLSYRCVVILSESNISIDGLCDFEKLCLIVVLFLFLCLVWRKKN